jgi:serine kinase of HPr protein (carbohydrate metabolism regulator)
VNHDEGGIRHAGLIARHLGGAWRGVLIEGHSGAGKSDLALRALSEGFRLVADDRVILWTSGGRLFGRAPDSLQGAMEVRGLDVVRQPALPMAPVSLVVRSGAGERIPQLQTSELLGISVPLLELDLRELSAPAKLSRALTLFDGAHKRRI